MIRSALMTVMTAAAQKAGRGLKRDLGEIENLQVSIKGPGDFVTAADKRAEKVLFEELSRARPGYGFIMEEGGVVEGTDKSHTWHNRPSRRHHEFPAWPPGLRHFDCAGAR